MVNAIPVYHLNMISISQQIMWVIYETKLLAELHWHMQISLKSKLL